MTRFWITLDRGVQLVLKALEEAQGGEIFVPKIPSMSVGDLIAAMPVECTQRIIGRRPGEKLHEVLIGEGEGTRTFDCGDFFVVAPEAAGYKPGTWATGANPVPSGFHLQERHERGMGQRRRDAPAGDVHRRHERRGKSSLTGFSEDGPVPNRPVLKTGATTTVAKVGGISLGQMPRRRGTPQHCPSDERWPRAPRGSAGEGMRGPRPRNS